VALLLALSGETSRSLTLPLTAGQRERRAVAALAHATGDCAFWHNADDVFDPTEREKLRQDNARTQASHCLLRAFLRSCLPHRAHNPQGDPIRATKPAGIPK
jgi:hypothetical protein